MGQLVSHNSVLFHLLVHLLNLLILPFLSLLEYTIFKIILRIIGVGRKIITPQEEKASHEEGRKLQMKVTVQVKLVVGYLGVDPHVTRS